MPDLAARYVQQPRGLEPADDPTERSLAEEVARGEAEGDQVLGIPRILTGVRVYQYRDALLLPINQGIVVATWCDEFWSIGGWFPNAIAAMRWLDRWLDKQA
jgi:hypothetical protein